MPQTPIEVSGIIIAVQESRGHFLGITWFPALLQMTGSEFLFVCALFPVP